MTVKKLSPQEIDKRRKQFFESMDSEFPPISDFVVTSSGIVEPVPTSQEEWDNFHENLQFVDGIEKQSNGTRN